MQDLEAFAVPEPFALKLVTYTALTYMTGALTAIHLYRANRHDAASPYLIQRRLVRSSTGPTSEIIKVGTSKAEDLLAQMTRIRLTPTPTFLQGCDGTTFTLSLGEELGNVRYRWWQDLPKEWEELRRPLGDLEKLGNLKGGYYS